MMGKLESTQKKRNSSWSEAYHIVYQTLWTQCYAMTTYDCQWKWVTSVCDDVTTDRSTVQYRAVLLGQIQRNAVKFIGSASQCKWLMTENIVQKQPKSLSRKRNWIFYTGQVSHLISAQQRSFSVSEATESQKTIFFRQSQTAKEFYRSIENNTYSKVCSSNFEPVIIRSCI